MVRSEIENHLEQTGHSWLQQQTPPEVIPGQALSDSMTNRRPLRVAQLIQQELANLLTFELRDPRLAFLSITRVVVSADLRHANVYISSLDGEEGRREIMKTLRHAGSYLRRELGLRTKLRYVPELAFHFDDGLIQSQHMSDLLDDLNSQQNDSPAPLPDDE